MRLFSLKPASSSRRLRAAMTSLKQIKEALRKPDTVTVTSADVLSVITNRLDSVTVITYTLKGEEASK